MNKKLLPLILLLVGMWTSASADHLSSSLLFTAQLSGENEVPEVATSARGLATFTFDEKKSTMYFNVHLTGLSGPITGMHIHEAPEGENGPVIIHLTPFLNGTRAKGAVRNISRASFAKFLTGDYYINVHTEENPGGEIRGQIYLETDHRYTAVLDGANEVPAVASGGRGLFVANLTGTTIDFNMVFQGLSSPVTGAHIHNAPAGSNGGVIIDLNDFLFGNVITGSVDLVDFIAALRAGELYVNVHTVDHPGGEIRGQLLLEEGLLFDAIVDGDQEFPPTTTSGRGIAMITVSPDLSTLNYYVVFDSLSSPTSGAHFHGGIAGSNGGVLIDLSENINGNILSGSTPITLDFLNQMLAGGIYLNIHTDDNPGGEIRGQVYKLAREPYVLELNGGQEVPPVSTSGSGMGYVTIDRDQSNAHYELMYHDLEGTYTMAHFHQGVPGENGGVIFNLTTAFDADGYAEGYWDQSSIPPFDAGMLFRNQEIYVNVHSDLHPGGEIRGNVLRVSEMLSDIPFDPGFGNNFIIVAELSGDGEEPPVTTDAVGLATLSFDEDRSTARINATVTGLSGPITGAHIHSGFSGENGPVIFPLEVIGNRIQTEIAGITADQLGRMMEGGMYINIHTEENPGGEIRGQFFIEQDLTFLATLGGDEEVPAVATDGKGLGGFHYAIGQLSLDVNIQVTDLSSPITGAHLHAAGPGENGPVVIDLMSLRDGNRFEGTVDLTIDDLIALLTGTLYVNVHTEMNPGGEIRGQLNYQNALVFDGWMSGLQEVPFATTGGSGYSVASVSNDLTSIDVWMVSDGLSGDVGMAHFHMAPIGTNGPVILDFTSSISDNDFEFSGPVTDQLVDALLSGNIYINAHTPAFPGGEIRGQMIRLAREGYAFDLCSEQEVGDVDAPNAEGSGMISIDRNHSNINMVIAADGLTSEVTGAHLHLAPIGVNGPVFFPFTEFFVDGIVSGAGIIVDDTAIINAIRTEQVYANIHTSTHAGGEVRGQVVNESLCLLETGIDPLGDLVHSVSLSPVPVIDQLQVEIESKTNTTLSVSVMDMSGKVISVTTASLLQGSNNTYINTESLHPGFYMLMLSDGNAAQAYKFVK